MPFWRGVKRRLRAAVAPCVFLALGGYFLWSATQGERGLNPQAEAARAQALAAAQDDVARADAERQVWERRVAALQSKGLDLDALDERVRAMLNLADPNDIIVMYPPGKKLF
jgi:cell division protein FtsB